MNETLVTVVGNVATQPDFREAANGAALARFRLAATVRRWDRGREEWADAYTSFYSVWAWRSLANNVVASVTIGEPVLVQGRLRINTQERDGRRWTSADIDAVAIGHDLARGTSAFRRVSPARPLPVEPVRLAGAMGKVAADVEAARMSAVVGGVEALPVGAVKAVGPPDGVSEPGSAGSRDGSLVPSAP
ncbi:single-stranded DNA-binding protein [Streptomyces mobaraensis NBRC 13819 = DSM 40847]|uniref:Single-stranded DNA-binding protein n=2 Tax=Streptomyces mobaraensis TaxID=35621 RepID=A0A5N5WCG0_STRMB|nr:single-stranded DNA-binding protein [Streptomyces mobaraensis]EME98118.1 single-strand DNA-binding protein [Streptomyces mobaraensis NBRC 13819 = DSM 40847]KAB7850016.1 single-stranded DNA-binding protein [Streptomyces mobaraensis]QTT73874.1 single-stranded DNA-binding protein [Streptomyces mobaraensis NBRC 13819 = DSM 40847]